MMGRAALCIGDEVVYHSLLNTKLGKQTERGIAELVPPFQPCADEAWIWIKTAFIATRFLGRDMVWDHIDAFGHLFPLFGNDVNAKILARIQDIETLIEIGGHKLGTGR